MGYGLAWAGSNGRAIGRSRAHAVHRLGNSPSRSAVANRGAPVGREDTRDAMPSRWAGIWRWAGLVARLVVGGVWIAAGWLKLPDPAESVRAVRAYDLLPESIVPTV